MDVLEALGSVAFDLDMNGSASVATATAAIAAPSSESYSAIQQQFYQQAQLDPATCLDLTEKMVAAQKQRRPRLIMWAAVKFAANDWVFCQNEASVLDFQTRFHEYVVESESVVPLDALSVELIGSDQAYTDAMRYIEFINTNMHAHQVIHRRVRVDVDTDQSSWLALLKRFFRTQAYRTIDEYIIYVDFWLSRARKLDDARRIAMDRALYHNTTLRSLVSTTTSATRTTSSSAIYHSHHSNPEKPSTPATRHTRIPSWPLVSATKAEGGNATSSASDASSSSGSGSSSSSSSGDSTEEVELTVQGNPDPPRSPSPSPSPLSRSTGSKRKEPPAFVRVRRVVHDLPVTSSSSRSSSSSSKK